MEIGADCENIIMNYKYDLELNEHKKKFKPVVNTLFNKIRTKHYFQIKMKYYNSTYVDSCSLCFNVNNSTYINRQRRSNFFRFNTKPDFYKCIVCKHENILDEEFSKAILNHPYV